MDLGIAGKWALVCGASKGLGLGCFAGVWQCRELRHLPQLQWRNGQTAGFAALGRLGHHSGMLAVHRAICRAASTKRHGCRAAGDLAVAVERHAVYRLACTCRHDGY